MTKVNPNTRFGASFLDKHHKRYAELGEVVIDKITGELLLKRKIDGKLISFTQNDKYLHDIMIELRILMKNYTSFTYPSTETSWFASSDFNIEDITGYETDVLNATAIEFYSQSLDPKNRFEFNLSKDTNGFFIRPISRDTDKAFLEYITNLYNLTFQEYNGTNTNYIAERALFANAAYYSSNASITFSVAVTGKIGSDIETRTFSSTAYIRINEETMVSLPENYASGFDSISTIKVNVSKISFHKFEMIMDYIYNTSTFDDTMYKALIAPDEVVKIEKVNIMNFLDDAASIPANDNIVNVALIDTVYMLDYVGKVDKLAGSSGYIPSTSRPSSDIWTKNNVWAELIRIVRVGGQSSETAHETDIDELEKYLYNTTGVVTKLTFDETATDDIYVEDTTK